MHSAAACCVSFVYCKAGVPSFCLPLSDSAHGFADVVIMYPPAVVFAASLHYKAPVLPVTWPASTLLPHDTETSVVGWTYRTCMHLRGKIVSMWWNINAQKNLTFNTHKNTDLQFSHHAPVYLEQRPSSWSTLSGCFPPLEEKWLACKKKKRSFLQTLWSQVISISNLTFNTETKLKYYMFVCFAWQQRKKWGLVLFEPCVRSLEWSWSLMRKISLQSPAGEHWLICFPSFYFWYIDPAGPVLAPETVVWTGSVFKALIYWS